jgi:hypothetical protein
VTSAAFLAAPIIMICSPLLPSTAMSPPPQAPPPAAGQAAAATAQTANVVLTCRPDRAGNRLVFQYTVSNRGAAEVYVMDALPKVDPATRQATVDRHTAVIWLAADGFAHILKGIAPLPPGGRHVAVRSIPLAARLVAGQALERVLEVPLPLAETDPYHPDLPLREYQLVDINGIVLSIEFLRSTVEGFSAEPVDFAPELYRVRGNNTAAQTQRVSCAFPSRQLQILKRPDAFPRPN